MATVYEAVPAVGLRPQPSFTQPGSRTVKTNAQKLGLSIETTLQSLACPLIPLDSCLFPSKAGSQVLNCLEQHLKDSVSINLRDDWTPKVECSHVMRPSLFGNMWLPTCILLVGSSLPSSPFSLHFVVSVLVFIFL